jgi:hypothetical protein
VIIGWVRHTIAFGNRIRPSMVFGNVVKSPAFIAKLNEIYLPLILTVTALELNAISKQSTCMSLSRSVESQAELSLARCALIPFILAPQVLIDQRSFADASKQDLTQDLPKPARTSMSLLRIGSTALVLRHMDALAILPVQVSGRRRRIGVVAVEEHRHLLQRVPAGFRVVEVNDNGRESECLLPYFQEVCLQLLRREEGQVAVREGRIQTGRFEQQ